MKTSLLFATLLLFGMLSAEMNYPAITLANQSFCDNFGDGGSCDRGYNANYIQIATMESDEPWVFAYGIGSNNTTWVKEGAWSRCNLNSSNLQLSFSSKDLSSYSNITMWISFTNPSEAPAQLGVRIGYNISNYFQTIITSPSGTTNTYYLNMPKTSFGTTGNVSWSDIRWFELTRNTGGCIDDLRAVRASGQFYNTMENRIQWTPVSGYWEIQNTTYGKVAVDTNATTGVLQANTTCGNCTIYVSIIPNTARPYNGLLIGSKTFYTGLQGTGDNATFNSVSLGASRCKALSVCDQKIIINGNTLTLYQKNSTDTDFVYIGASAAVETSIKTVGIRARESPASWFNNILIQEHIHPAVNTTDNSGTFTRGQSLECSALTNSSDGETVCDWYQNGMINQTAKRMVAYYPFDAPYSNSTNTLDMAITPTANATVSGATWTSNGKIGGAYSFAAGTNQINVGAVSFMNLSAADNFTVIAWVKTNNQSQINTIFGRALGTGANGTLFWINSYNTNDRKLWMQMHNGTVGAQQSVSCANTTVPLNTWTHVVGMKNGNELSLWINGIKYCSATGTFEGNFALQSSGWAIGAHSQAGGFNFNGSIDEVHIYNQSLTADEIGQIYRDGMIGKTLLENTATFKTKWYSKSVSATTQQSQNVTSISLATATLSPPTITPSLAHLNDTLTCNAGTFTQSDDVENVSARTWQWFINGAASVTTQTLAAGTFAITDEILCGETATGLYWGDTASAVSSEAQVISIFYTTYTMPNTTGFGSAFDYSRTVMTTATGYSFAFELMMIGTIFMCFYIIGSRYTQERALVYSTFLTLIVAFLMVSGNFLNPMWLILLIIALLVSIYLAGRIG